MTKRLERWTCNLKALNSSAALRLQPGCVLCRPKIKSSAKLVNNQLVCLLPVGILTNFVYSVLICWPQCKLLGTQQLRYQYKKRSLKVYCGHIILFLKSKELSSESVMFCDFIQELER